MKKYIILTFLLYIFVSCVDKNLQLIDKNEEKISNSPTKNEFGIIIHGGAGTILKEYMSDSLEDAYTLKLKEAVQAGYVILKNGGTSLEAVTSSINILEDSPLFNAGKGAVFTHNETNELDASIMDGATLNAGAVTGVSNVKNPINLALKVMTNSPHVMLSGKGAEEFAKEQNVEIVNPAYFYTPDRYRALLRTKEAAKDKGQLNSKPAYIEKDNRDSKFGTVGAAALDKHGNLAAGTSTGGMTNKRWNRIGDSPIIGAGTYANNTTCAVSSTGWGEFFIRAVVAHDISALMEYKGLTLAEAAKEVIQNKIPALGGDGGIVAIDKDGNMVAEFNTAGMYRASINDKGEMSIKIYKE